MSKTIILVLGIMLFIKIKDYKIEWNTLFKRGIKPIDDRFGVYCITGKQGSFKSFRGIHLLLAQDKNLCNKIKTNMKSIKIPGYNIEYFDKISDIYKDSEEYCIYLIDEISRKYDKNCRTDTQFYAWLNQSRKTHRIVILITQEWKELPMWLRRPIKFSFTTLKNRLLNRFHLYITIVGDAENMVLDKDEMEWNCPTIGKILWKPTQEIASMYDTFEVVSDL